MLKKSQLHKLYYWLQLNRVLEGRLVSLHRAGKIFGALYSSRGQEAISVGSAFALKRKDVLVPGLRNIGALLVRGFRPEEILAQHMGRDAGPARGRECGAFMGDLPRGIAAPIAVLGAGVPVVAGIALAAKMQNLGIVALTYIGDGAANTSDFHEGFNLAAVRKVPLVLVIEDNGWAYSTPTSQHAACADLISRAPAYGVAGFEVDGNDVIAVHQTALRAADHARRGGGPALIVARTMRMEGLGEPYDAWFVPAQESDPWKSKDPVRRFEKHLSESGHISTLEISAIRKRVHSEIDRATRLAGKLPFPEGKQCLPGVYGEVLPDREAAHGSGS